MQPGRELDALIAEKVMGQNTRGLSGCGSWGCGCSSDPYPHLPKYSEDIAAAWRVVEKLDGTYEPVIERHGPGWTAWFDSNQAWADTAPLAICLAALKAVGVQVE